MSDWHAWFSGFFDGEGSLQCAVYRDKVVFAAVITQRADDLPLLHEIHDRMGGSVHTWVGHRGGRNEMACWRMNGSVQLVEQLAPVLAAYPLRTKKAREWSLVLPLAAERAAQRNPGSGHTSRAYLPGFLDRVRVVNAEPTRMRRWDERAE